ncbi:TonB-dependent receptor [Geminicoccaceae bacterium 1502E]|nr:TonB-dependent receptor [Geminicoccaceae bacterium 1502E]
MPVVWRHAIVVGMLMAATAAPAAAGCVAGQEVARLVAADGEVRVEDRGFTGRGMLVCAGEVVQVGPRSRASVYLLAADTVLRLDENSASRIAAPPEPQGGLVELMEGALYFLSEVRRSLTIRTPYVNAGVEGTEVLVVLPDGDDTDAGAEILVLDGQVRLTPAGEPVSSLPERLGSGEAVLVAQGQAQAAPVAGDMATLLRQRLAWTLFYPSVLTEAERQAHPRLAEAEALLGAGQAAEARRLLEAVPSAGTRGALREALLAIEAVAMQDRARALELALRAREMAPGSAGALLALSQARQIGLDLDGARLAAEEAVAAAPQSPLARARLAELLLMQGRSRAARREAEEARRLGGGAIAELVQGYVALTALDTAAAQAAFERALEADSENPNAHLGRGLALIRQGEVEEGRREIEIAIAQAPNDALLRAWLGRAYLAENRGNDSAGQLRIARTLDPDDPTAFLYAALGKQLANRPIEALDDVERSIELNDNRALYRSRLLLDEDRAVRGVGLGRIYQDLGFDRLGQAEAGRSLAADPSSPAAHRFLSDLYQGRARLEVARASELLRSQLLDPFDTNPVQPSLPYIDLNTLEESGPARAGFNEFTPLFERDGVRFTGTGGIGTHETWTDEAALAATAGRATFSLGQYHYETDGFRDNAGVEHDIYNAFGQVLVTPELSLQAEYRRRDSDEGDVALRFDPDSFRTDQTRKIGQDTARLGLRYQEHPGSTFIVSALWADRNERLFTIDEPAELRAKTKTNGVDLQAQHILRTDNVALVTGGGVYRIERDQFFDTKVDLPFLPQPLRFGSSVTNDVDQANLYSYVDWRWPEQVVWTAGLAYDNLDADAFTKDRFSPKLGVRWQVTPDLELRAAYTETLKRDLLVDQTLEPTMVAGFNQLFDDFSGTTAKRLGAGLDARLAKGLHGGLEASRRWLELPVIVDGGRDAEFERGREETVSGYLYWTLTPRLAWRTELVYDRYSSSTDAGDEPREVTTLALPTGPVYFHPDGLFASLGATFLWQEVERGPAATLKEGSDETVLVDAVVGYRLPNRRGLLSLEVRNLFDTRFDYQDENYRTREDVTSGILPERTIFARLTLGF